MDYIGCEFLKKYRDGFEAERFSSFTSLHIRTMVPNVFSVLRVWANCWQFLDTSVPVHITLLLDRQPLAPVFLNFASTLRALSRNFMNRVTDITLLGLQGQEVGPLYDLLAALA